MSRLNPVNIVPFRSQQESPCPPDDHESVPLIEVSDRLLGQAIAAARADEREKALALFDEALKANEDNVEALLWRGGLSAANESLPFLERAAYLDPKNMRVQEGLEWARQRVGLTGRPSAPPPAPTTPAPSSPPAVAQRPVRTAAPTAAPAPRPAPPSLSLPLPDLAGLGTRILAHLVERPTSALIIAVLLLGLLATAAVTRAGLNRDADDPISPTTAFVSTAPLDGVKSVTSASPVAEQPLPSTKAGAPTPALSTTVMTLDQAWAASDWPQVLTIVEGMLKRTPGDQALIDKKFKALYNYGVQLVRSERLAEAIVQFDKAIAINAEDINLRAERQIAQLYLEGSTALASGDYGMAVRPLRTIYDGNPGYRSVKERLYQAYIGWAGMLEKENKQSDAWTYYQKASKVDPQGQEALAGMTKLQNYTPASVIATAGRKIEVSLARQQVTVYQDNKVLWVFKASTGKAPYGTRTGNFEILNKLPDAYSRALGWGMPNWMGIYQAGGTENGFHAMARLRNGSVLSTSVLGRPATSGCIMLSDADARKLYDWAIIGTPVTIR